MTVLPISSTPGNQAAQIFRVGIYYQGTNQSPTPRGKRKNGWVHLCMYRYISHGHGFNPQIKLHHSSSVPLAEIVSRLSRMAAKLRTAPGGILLISSVASKKDTGISAMASHRLWPPSQLLQELPQCFLIGCRGHPPGGQCFLSCLVSPPFVPALCLSFHCSASLKQLYFNQRSKISSPVWPWRFLATVNSTLDGFPSAEPPE